MLSFLVVGRGIGVSRIGNCRFDSRVGFGEKETVCVFEQVKVHCVLKEVVVFPIHV